MDKIKMSDVFEPKLTGQTLVKTLGNCVTAGVKWLTQYTYAATAINAYDANQERIAELEAFLDKFVEASQDDTLITVDEAIELQRGSK